MKDRRDAEAINACLASAGGDDSLPSACGLRRLSECTDFSDELRAKIKNALDAGFTLRKALPAIDPALLHDWIGDNWFLLHRHYLDRVSHWTSIVASRLNRNDADFACWPRWIESAVRSLAHDGRTLLVVPGTTTSSMLEPLARQAMLERLTVCLPAGNRKPAVFANELIGSWLLRALDQITHCQSVAYATLFLHNSDDSPITSMAKLPLQDRVAIALSHNLLSLSLRQGGNIAQLVQRRLQDNRFPLGTVSLRIPSSDMRADHDWLDRRAIGWYVPWRTCAASAPTWISPVASCCQTDAASVPKLATWIAEARLLMSLEKYLIHCVRGHHADAFREGDCTAVIDAIVHGHLSSTTPYDSLVKIVSQRRLRASSKLLRTNVAAVSFTGVPLFELMARRRYQSHLGRWDWEPYGMMIRREALLPLGARPVIYGDDHQYEQLDAHERNFFQPAHRRSARASHEHWQAEEEWRLLDDLRLNQLPSGSVLLFVQTKSQAQALAAHSPWPVIWLQADQTQWSPVVAERRRRSSARISKN